MSETQGDPTQVDSAAAAESTADDRPSAEAGSAAGERPSAEPGAAADDLTAVERRRLAVAKIMLDYCDDAVVNDPLFGKPLVGKAAIAVHKTAEMIALSDVTLNVTDRWTQGSDLVAIWEVTGTHSGPYYNLPATGRRISINGATIVTRRDGKIAQETLYYDAEDMRRQLTAESAPPLHLPEPDELTAQGEAEQAAEAGEQEAAEAGAEQPAQS